MNELELSAILGLFIEFSEDFQRQKFKMESEDGPPSLAWIFSPSECMLKTSNTIFKFLELPVQNATVRDVKGRNCAIRNTEARETAAVMPSI